MSGGHSAGGGPGPGIHRTKAALVRQRLSDARLALPESSVPWRFPLHYSRSSFNFYSYTKGVCPRRRSSSLWSTISSAFLIPHASSAHDSMVASRGRQALEDKEFTALDDLLGGLAFLDNAPPHLQEFSDGWAVELPTVMELRQQAAGPRCQACRLRRACTPT